MDPNLEDRLHNISIGLGELFVWGYSLSVLYRIYGFHGSPMWAGFALMPFGAFLVMDGFSRIGFGKPFYRLEANP